MESNVNEYLEFCKATGLNPLDESSLKRYKNSKVKKETPKDITLAEIFKDCKETIRLENVEDFKKRVLMISKSYKKTTDELAEELLKFIFENNI